MSTKSPYRPTITKEELHQLPIKAFEGPIRIVSTAEKAAGVLREVTRHKVVGFDTETKPSFRKNEYHSVALMQLAVPGKAFLIRLHQTGMSDEIMHFLEDEGTLKAGVGLQNDLIALRRLRPFSPGGFVELTQAAKQNGLRVESLSKLAGLVCGFRISKRAQVSNWEADPYTDKQIRYAATDAWVSLRLYEKLLGASPLR